MALIAARRALLRPAAPVALPAVGGLQAWYKADAGTSTVTDGAAVASWNDQSGSARTASQATGSKQPLYAAAFLNGRPVLQFDGADDCLTTAAFTLAQPKTVFVVFRAANAGYALDAVSAGEATHVNATAATTMRMAAGTAVDATVANAQGAWHVVAATFNGASSSLSVDGTKTSGNAGTNAGSGLTIGSYQGQTVGSFLNGYVAEVLAYSGALSDADRRSIEAYLGLKYAITVV